MKKQKKELNDLLLPILFVIAFLPFITRLIVYESGLSKFLWFSDNDLTTDFFTYYKSNIFLILIIICTIVLLFLFLFYKSTWKRMHPYLPLIIYVAALLLSTIFSVDTHTSLVGGVGRFESLFVLLGYIILSIYTYQVVIGKEDFETIIKTFSFTVFLFIIIGSLQMIGQDPFFFKSIQKLIIPKDYWASYLGELKSHLSSNAISLSLSNPNYVSVYMSMIIPFFLSIIITIESKKAKILYSVFISLMFILLFMTNSRTGLISLFSSSLILLYFYRSYLKNIWKHFLPIPLFLVFLVTALDSFSGFPFLSKISATFNSFNKELSHYNLEEMLTNKDHIYLRYRGEELYISFNYNPNNDTNLKFIDKSGQDVSSLYDPIRNTLVLEPFDTCKFNVERVDNTSFYIVAKIDNYIWNFSYHKDKGYQYLNDLGKADSLIPIKSFGFKDHQNIASNRGYIWSRSLPLLKDKFFIGSGPDTFLLIYPQGDYVGKSNNCKTPYTLIEKSHNLYLTIALQTGIISLISFLVFFLMFFKRSVVLYRKYSLDNYMVRIGIGSLVACLSYMISGFFNDSSIHTSPLFWVFIGLGMAANNNLEKSLSH